MDITFHKIIECVINIWMAAGMFFFLFGWLNIPILVFFVPHRFVQLHDRLHDVRVTTPTHAALHYFCAIFYGLLLPAFYFLSARGTRELAWWELGRGTNTSWSIVLAVACMGWMAAHLFDAAARGGAIRFGRNWVDRGFAVLAFLLCIRYQILTLGQGLAPAIQGAIGVPPIQFLIAFIYPQTFFLAVTALYGLACVETFFGRGTPPSRRHWRVAIPLAVGALAVAFCPYWLSLPRVPHRQALAMIGANCDLIDRTARRTRMDPALLAGIIYVAQTRDHPRWTGNIMERTSARMWGSASFSGGPQLRPFLNASGGLAQMRPATAIQTCYLVDRAKGFSQAAATGAASPTTRPVSLQNIYTYWHRSAANNSSISQLSPSLTSDTKVLSLPLHEPARTGNMDDLLFIPANNLALEGLMLTLLREQWREAGHPIDDRPEILATLYNIGYELSRPHVTPKANDFGRRVAAFMKSEECRKMLEEHKPIEK